MKKLATTVLAATFALGACGDITGPGEGQATFQVAAQGDDPSAQQSSQGTTSTYSQPMTSTDGRAQGEVEFRAQVEVQTRTGGWITLNQLQEVHVDASGQETKTFASTRVDADSYTRIRVTFENVKANVTGGIQIGTGFLAGEVRVNLGSEGQTVVEREIDVNAGAGATTTLLINLNSSQWLNRADAQAKTVSEADFRSAVQIVAR